MNGPEITVTPRQMLAVVVVALVAVVATVVGASEANAVACSKTTACDWTDYHYLNFASGPVSYGDTIGACSYSDDIYLSAKKATTLGIAACDQSGVQMYYSATNWAGWSSWVWSEYTASYTTSGNPVKSYHRIDPWE